MSGSQINLTFRVRPTFGPEKCIQMVQLLVESMFFDEEAQFDLMIKKNNDERLHDELTPVDLGTFINPQTWPEIHQLLFYRFFEKRRLSRTPPLQSRIK